MLRGRKFQLPTAVTGLRTFPILTSLALWYHSLTHLPPGVSWHHLPNKSFALESLSQGLLLGEQAKTLSFLHLCVYKYYQTHMYLPTCSQMNTYMTHPHMHTQACLHILACFVKWPLTYSQYILKSSSSRGCPLPSTLA